MLRFEVDVKAVVKITVEALNADDARTVADVFVEESMSMTARKVAGYNYNLPDDTIGTVVPLDYKMEVAETSDVQLSHEAQ